MILLIAVLFGLSLAALAEPLTRLFWNHWPTKGLLVCAAFPIPGLMMAIPVVGYMLFGILQGGHDDWGKKMLVLIGGIVSGLVFLGGLILAVLLLIGRWSVRAMSITAIIGVSLALPYFYLERLVFAGLMFAGLSLLTLYGCRAGWLRYKSHLTSH